MDIQKKWDTLKNCVKLVQSYCVRCVNLLPYWVTGLSLPRGYYEDSEEWFKKAQRNSGEDMVVLDEPTMLKRELPKGLPLFFGKYFSNRLCASSSPRRVLTLMGARVFSERGIIITHDNKIIGDVTIAYAKKPKEHPVFRRLRFPPIAHLDGTCGIAYSPAPGNYYHWVYEIVPQLMMLNKLLVNGEIDVILVSCDKDFQRQWLEILQIDQEKVRGLDRATHLCIDKLVVPSMPSRNAEVAPWTFKDLKLAVEKIPEADVRKRIYIVRESGNRALKFKGEGKQDLLDKYGFESFVLETMSVKEQIQMFRSAEVILASHGAGLTGICFCPKNTKIIEILAPKFLNVCYWRIAGLMSLPYYYLLAEGVNNLDDIPRPVAGKADLKIGLDNLEELLKMAHIDPVKKRM